MSILKVLETAKDEIGYKEYPVNSNRTKYGRWYGLDGNPWCMMFVMWVFDQAGEAKALPTKTASCSALMNAAKNSGQWVSAANIQAGDVIIYDFPGNNVKTDHTGICESVIKSGGKVTGVYSIEGNTSTKNESNGGTVMRRTRGISLCLGAVRPSWVAVEARKALWIVAQEVLLGKWGNGDARAQKLKAAGYDSAAVQKIVNALSRGNFRVAVDPAKVKTLLNIRAEPSTASRILETLRPGSILPVSKIQEGPGSNLGWGKVSNGWISMDYVEQA